MQTFSPSLALQAVMCIYIYMVVYLKLQPTWVIGNASCVYILIWRSSSKLSEVLNISHNEKQNPCAIFIAKFVIVIAILSPAYLLRTYGYDSFKIDRYKNIRSPLTFSCVYPFIIHMNKGYNRPFYYNYAPNLIYCFSYR